MEYVVIFGIGWILYWFWFLWCDYMCFVGFCCLCNRYFVEFNGCYDGDIVGMNEEGERKYEDSFY